MELLKRKKELLKIKEEIDKEIEKINRELLFLNKKKCEHKKVYKYTISKIEIYQCKMCRTNLRKEEILDKKVKIRNF